MPIRELRIFKLKIQDYENMEINLKNYFKYSRIFIFSLLLAISGFALYILKS